MCGRFQGVPLEIVEQIIRDIEMARVAHAMPDWPLVRKSVYPKSEAAVIVPAEGHLAAALMTWGYTVSWNKNVVFNTRADTAQKPGSMWADSLAHRRCIVPTFGFFEPHRTETFISPQSGRANKQHYLFTLPNAPLLYLAGVFEKNQFSVLTTEPNDAVLPIHDRMPVVLKQCELDTWLTGDYLSLFDRSGIELAVSKVAG